STLVLIITRSDFPCPIPRESSSQDEFCTRRKRMTTMIVDLPSKRSLGVGFDANRNRAGNPQAWKQQIGTKQIPARLALLPDAKPNWHRVGISAGVQLSILIFLIIIPIIYPEQMKTAIHYSFTALAQPVTEIPVA